MSPITMDFSNVEGGGGDFTPVPAGAYKCNVFNVEERTGKESGKPYLNVELKIAEGEHAGRKLWTNVSLQEQSAWALKGFLLALGFTEEQLSSEFSFELTDIMGKACTAIVSVGDWQGKPTNNVESIRSINESTPPAAPAGASANSW